jgi:DNA-binding HxlR family transcriptional regulator
MEMTRRTKDGTFLDTLVRLGLLQVATDGKSPLESTYALTERGRHAAEYGVYQVEWEEYKALTQKIKAAAAKASEKAEKSKRGAAAGSGGG